MLKNEKDLEDYICDNQNQFIKTLTEIFGNKNEIKFLGRQVKIGEDNITDLIYYYNWNEPTYIKDEIPVEHIDFIIVELKYRELEPTDLSQLQRYMNVLQEKLDEDYLLGKINKETNVHGVFVSFGENIKMQEISMANNISNISYISIKPRLEFNIDNWSYKDEYIHKLVLDERFSTINKECEDKNGKIKIK